MIMTKDYVNRIKKVPLNEAKRNYIRKKGPYCPFQKARPELWA
jgi:hypothetical protein